MGSSEDFDLFGDRVIKDVLLRDKFLEPPFSILDAKSGSWQNRKRQWNNLGMRSEVGRDGEMTFRMPIDKYRDKSDQYLEEQKRLNTSIFDPALCELIYHCFVPEAGSIIDPFAGGSVRGIVANYLGYKYTGIDIRQVQIDSNREQAIEILDVNNQPNWYVGDSNILLNEFVNSTPRPQFDFLFSCPPYADLEVYSDLPGDISNMNYPTFLEAYENIIYKSCQLLKFGGYACFVVGEVRNKYGNFIGFVPDTIAAFKKSGLSFYNEAILLNMVASASMRADKQFTSGKKLVKIHQNVLIFKK